MDLIYRVAGHVFSVRAECAGAQMPCDMQAYEPFAVEASDVVRDEKVFSLEIVQNAELIAFAEQTRQVDEGQEISCGRLQDGSSIFEFYLGERTTGQLVCSADFCHGKILLSGYAQKFAVNNALMVMYALATANKGTLLFHSAVVSCDGFGYMFLGKSGTGKSTHARLWLEHISGTELLNDDNPVVRVFDDGVKVYGSPWSGKTPCYKNRELPLGGIVLLSQAPHNEIALLHIIEAYGAVVASVSGMRWNREIADGLHNAENELVKRIKIWHLECLPNAAAAEICHAQIKV